MSTSFPNYQPTDAWTDVLAKGAYSGLINRTIIVQTIADGAVKLFAGGASAPAGADQGYTLVDGQNWIGTTDHLWVRGQRALIALARED